MKRLFLAIIMMCFTSMTWADTISSWTQRVATESTKASYRIQFTDIVPAATATDVATLCGSATKIIRINKIEAAGDATSASVIDFYFLKRTTLDTGGTATSPTIAQNDSADFAATATVKLYSANPTALGTGVMFVAAHYALPAAASTGYPGSPYVADFGIRNERALVLRGVNECLAFNLNGQTIPAGFSGYLNISWTEE